jgi:hypothetical protein
MTQHDSDVTGPARQREDEGLPALVRKKLTGAEALAEPFAP